MNDRNDGFTRKRFIGSAIALPALAAAIPGLARADSKASQASLHYQDKPNGDYQCSKCKFFIAAGDPSANGTCQIVEGSISPHGFCDAFSSKS